MKASVVSSFGGRFETRNVTIADPVGREVLVDVRASGLCHTDLTASRYDIGFPVPAVFGHEVSGVVAVVGPDVTDFAPGDHVVGCLVQYCGRCARCLTGRPGLCEHPEATLRAPGEPPRLSLDGAALAQAFGLGGFAERALIHEAQLVKVPDAVPFAQAALLGCGVVTGAGAVLNTAQVRYGDSVVVIGAGGVGLNAINGAVTAGASTIIAVDIAGPKLAKARTFGATHVVNSAELDPVPEVRAITGSGADAVFDFVGIPDVTAKALEMTAPGGGLYLIGVIDPTAMLPLSTISAIASGKRIQGVYMGSTVPRRDIPAYASLYLRGRFNLDGLVSREISLDEVSQGYAALQDPEVARVVITKF